MKEVGTLKELGVKVGDVVKVHGLINTGEIIENGGEWIVKRYDVDVFGVKPEYKSSHKGVRLSNSHLFRIISRATDTPKLWIDMTPEEKGELLLAYHEGKRIEFYSGTLWHQTALPAWNDETAYRVKPEPKVEIVALYGKPSSSVQWVLGKCKYDTHRITFNLIDGKPDCESIKMEPLV